ncbi:MAG: HAD family hydrolase [Deltaproteobacteria bacterium]|nr:HAD family hydrolase [Deltaproteobacteria bacterium]
MTISSVIFDLYGTLVDIETDESDPALYAVLSQFLTYYEIFLSPKELAARYQEVSAAHLMEHHNPFGEIDVFQVFEEILEKALNRKVERAMVLFVARLFRSLSRRRFGLFSDTIPALQELSRDFRLGIVSDAQWVFSEPEIRMLGLNSYFDTIVLSSRYFIRKPDPQIYAHALKAMWLPPSQALYVGNDPDADVPGPQALGMPVLIIDRTGQRRDLPVPVIKDLRAVLAFIRSRY